MSAMDRFFMAIFYSRYFVDRIDLHDENLESPRDAVLRRRAACRNSRKSPNAGAAISPIMTTLSTYMSAAAAANASRRRGREDQAHDSRHAGRHDLGLRTASRTFRDQLRPRL